MQLFVNGATATVGRYAGHPALGRLIQPRSHNDVAQLAAGGLDHGADNDALAGVDPLALLDLWRQLAAARSRRLRFVTAPDAVELTPDGPRGDWPGTLWLWRCWRPALAQLALPGAIVAQDGATVDSVPWAEIAALFIGGSTRWKLSRSAALLIRTAHARGKWVHVGRINSFKRIDHFDSLPVDSFDGGQFSMFPDTYIPRYLKRLEHKQESFRHAA